VTEHALFDGRDARRCARFRSSMTEGALDAICSHVYYVGEFYWLVWRLAVIEKPVNEYEEHNDQDNEHEAGPGKQEYPFITY